jgi:hypothetical protein
VELRHELDGIVILTMHRYFLLALLYASTLVCTQVASAKDKLITPINLWELRAARVRLTFR